MFKKIYIIVAIAITVFCIFMELDAIIGYWMNLPKGIFFSTKGVENFPAGSHFMLIMFMWFAMNWNSEYRKNFKTKKQ